MGAIGSLFALYFLASELGISLCCAEDICAKFFAAHIVEYFIARLKIFASVYVIFSKSAVQSRVPVILERCEVRRFNHSALLSGPGKIGRAFGLTLQDNGRDFTRGPLGIAAGMPVTDRDVTVSRRIGISRAVELPYRFAVLGSRSVSARGT